MLQLNPGGRGVPDLQVTEMIEWGQKSKPKKLPGRKMGGGGGGGGEKNKPQKTPGTKNYPLRSPPPQKKKKKKSHAEFPSLKFPEGIK